MREQQISSSFPYPLRGELSLPSDKSITHRAIIFSAIAGGQSRVRASAFGRDNLASIRVMGQLGVKIDGFLTKQCYQLALEEGLSQFSLSEDNYCELQIEGKGLGGLSCSSEPLDCGNSGTTARLLSGLLAGQPFCSSLIGDESLSARPFARVVQPLASMGAKFSGDTLPLEIRGGVLNSITYDSPRASAQVKTALILAGLQASGGVVVTEPRKSRDHSERMLGSMGAPLVCRELSTGEWQVEVRKEAPALPSLAAIDCLVPGDFSSAAFFLVAASLLPGSDIKVLNVGINPSRIGLLHLLRRMGAKIELSSVREVSGEPVSEIRVLSAELSGIEVSHEEVVLAIDEIPALCVAAAFARGKTIIRGASELRVKESDRLAMMASLLAEFGVEVEEYDDGLSISGKRKEGAEHFCKNQKVTTSALCSSDSPWRQCHDHRILMCAAILSYLSGRELGELNLSVIETSFPGFIELFEGLIRFDDVSGG